MTTNNALNLSATGVPYYNGTGIFTAPSLTQYAVIIGGTATNSITDTNVGAAGTVLVGTGTAPLFTSVLTLSTPLPVGSGGTGSSGPYSGYGVAVFNSAGTALTSIPISSGEVLIGTTTAPLSALIGAGMGISITTGSGIITINATGPGGTGGGVTWVNATATPQAMAVGTGYITDYTGGILNYMLPTAAAAYGDTLIIVGGVGGTSGWTLTYATGQRIYFGSAASTTGTGSLGSTNEFDSVTLRCIVTGTASQWTVSDSIGNITIN